MGYHPVSIATKWHHERIHAVLLYVRPKLKQRDEENISTALDCTCGVDKHDSAEIANHTLRIQDSRRHNGSPTRATGCVVHWSVWA